MGKRLVIAAAMLAVLAATAGVALAQTGHGSTRPSGQIHVVLPSTGGHVEFFDFNGDGLSLGDRLASVGPIVDESQTHRVGTSYLDCWVAGAQLLDGSPYDCTNVLRFADGTINTQGLDPHGLSDVFFAVTGGTGAYEGASGQAEYIDTTQTDIIISLDG